MPKLKPRILLTVVTDETKWEFSTVEGRVLANGDLSQGPTPRQFAIANKAIADLLVNLAEEPPMLPGGLPGHKVTLTYFKESGKLYTRGEFITTSPNLFDAVKDVADFHAMGKLPGLVDGAGADFAILIELEGAPPHLFVP